MRENPSPLCVPSGCLFPSLRRCVSRGNVKKMLQNVTLPPHNPRPHRHLRKRCNIPPLRAKRGTSVTSHCALSAVSVVSVVAFREVDKSGHLGTVVFSIPVPIGPSRILVLRPAREARMKIRHCSTLKFRKPRPQRGNRKNLSKLESRTQNRLNRPSRLIFRALPLPKWRIPALLPRAPNPESQTSVSAPGDTTRPPLGYNRSDAPAVSSYQG